MICQLCKKDKPCKEFLTKHVTKKCKHPLFHCYRCMIERLPTERKCPYPGCCQGVSGMTETYVEEYKEILELMYPVFIPPERGTEIRSGKHSEGDVFVILLDGREENIKLTPEMSVLGFKQKIKETFRIEVESQRLLYKENELKLSQEDGSFNTMKDMGVTNGAIINLVVILYSIPKQLNHVVFDISWGFPKKSEDDHLDASVLIYNGKSKLRTVDYHTANTRNFIGIKHSGDKFLDKANRIGHHIIEVELHALPENVTHLFFTLSAWESRNIAQFINPSLKFYEASNRQQDLCSTSFDNVKKSPAVIMCAVTRQNGGQWQIVDLGKASKGDAENYKEINKTIDNLLAQGI